MLKAARHRIILDRLSERGSVSVTELARDMSSSAMTIRRDLIELEEMGVLVRVHGGAVRGKTDAQPSFDERRDENRQEKARIAAKAASLIQPNMVVSFDAGTTSLMTAELAPDFPFTAITAGIMTANALCRRAGVNVIQVGGALHKSSYTATGFMAVEGIQSLNADLCFISTRAIDLNQGTMEPILPLIEVKRALVSVAKKVVLLADHTKFATTSLSLGVPMGEIDTLITDEAAPQDALAQLRRQGVEIILA